MKLLPTLSLVTSALATTLHTIQQFPNGTWLENLALMPNGSLLVTVIGRPEVHVIHPNVSPATSHLVASIPSANAVLGITALSPLAYAVAAGNVTATNSPIIGSFSIWTIDLSCSPPGVAKVVDLHNVSMVNGLTTLNHRTLLLADSWAGNVVKLDIQTKRYAPVLEHPTLKPDFTSPTLQIGVNGVRRFKSYVYYTNTVRNILGRVKVDLETGVPTGPFTTIAHGDAISQPDDFAVEKDGSVLLARPLGDTLQRVHLDGRVEELARGGVASGATSVVVREGRVWLSESGLENGVATGGGRVVSGEL
jgi:hypothetical protein